MFIVTKEIDSENISKLCRTCLREDNDKMVCLFMGPSGSSLAAKLRSLSCLEVWQGDGLPEKMCDRCVTRAESALLFREQCRAADSALRQAAFRVAGMRSCRTVSTCRRYQQAQGFLSIPSAQETLKCVECGEVFMNYQELHLHNRFHVPFTTNNKFSPQQKYTVEPQNSFLNLNQVINNSINININNASGSVSKSNTTSYSRAEEDSVNCRTACALHCSLCNYTFTNRTQLINHKFAHNEKNADFIRNDDNVKVKENLNFSKRIFVSEKSIHRIMEKSTSNHQYPVFSSMNENNKIENVVFSDNSALDKEQQLSNVDCKQNIQIKVKDPKLQKYTCELCTRTFSQKSKLQTHRLLHSDRRPYKCFRCEKAYASKSKLNAHIRLHTKLNIHQCKLCNKIFTYPSYLEEHMKTHKLHSNEVKDQKKFKLNFECSICKKRFSYSKMLNAHLRLHSEKGFSQCNICDKKFSQKYSLKIHLQAHEAKKLHKCRYCDKSFTQKSNLVEHTRVHTKMKPFECNLCYKKFSQSSHLKNHTASHNSIRQYQCQLCEKRFKLANHLKRHLNSHTQLKAFRCDKCNQMFSQAFSLKRHLKKHNEFLL